MALNRGVEQIVKRLDTPTHGFDNRGLRYHTSHAGSYQREVLVDPAPCYPHSVELVEKELWHLQKVAPLPLPMAIFLLCHEELGRTNAWCENACYWDKDNNAHAVAIITVNGKRIPPHPAMTRYLIAHEYGHAVNNYLVKHMGVTDSAFDTTYIESFRPKASTAYGCGKWHSNVGELIANDFRILVAKRELEFWPHEGFDRPENVRGLTKFWEEAQNTLINGKTKCECDKHISEIT